jgi:hypothetical protein
MERRSCKLRDALGEMSWVRTGSPAIDPNKAAQLHSGGCCCASASAYGNGDHHLNTLPFLRVFGRFCYRLRRSNQELERNQWLANPDPQKGYVVTIEVY